MRTWVRIPNDFFYNFTVCFLVYVRSSSNHKWFYSNFCILLFLNHLKACIFLIILILFNFGIITKIFTIKRHNITTTCTLLVSRPSSRAVWRTSVSSNFNEVHWFESNVIFFLLNCSVRFDCLFVCFFLSFFLSFFVSLFLCILSMLNNGMQLHKWGMHASWPKHTLMLIEIYKDTTILQMHGYG